MNKFERHKDVLFSTLAEITSLIIAGNDKRLIFEKLLECCLVVLEAERVYLLEIAGDDVIRYSKLVPSVGSTELKIETVADSPVIRDWIIKESRDQEEYRRGMELAWDLSSVAKECLTDQGSHPRIISAPLVAKRSMFGLLVAIHDSGGGIYEAEDLKLVTVLANQAAIALENRQLYQKLEKEAITDGLTAVYNYRYLIACLETEIKRATRFRQRFSFVMLDVDNLKQYNDRLGHLHGSQALCDVAQIIRQNCREIDLVSKYGGDEFGIMLPQTDMSGAETVSRRVLDAVVHHRFDGRTPGLLTCSAGIAMFPDDGTTVRELIASADRALYQAKRSGKNRVLGTRQTVGEFNSEM